ncbi:L-alanine-DL-glutamate epimerase-like enolase superfamily enzyme [Parvibaculum indicum]|uniref:N-acetyl-D-Glu racemase DgcA n=1 Tax=Parvibaculum indicum TaxID=562969 RepID=UPI001420871D|nr:N-acetyl-D-Glu racemase DgcA [Parvibaculum indicum]NIJ41084.1 L-alanine-DL-glutamate epimerase-like enolase superfamily enzyme [Parvibaculum indicum]
MRTVYIEAESWPLREAFVISRGSKTEARTISVTIEEGGFAGRGECVPYLRYGENEKEVIAAIRAQEAALRDGLSREALQRAMPRGAARNAIDCALWDLEAKKTGQRAWQLAGLPKPLPRRTAYTISLDEPDAMREAARRASDRPLLKIKMGGGNDIDRLRAVREGAPSPALIVDANEAWTPDEVRPLASELAKLGVSLIEQPLPAKDDEALRGIESPIPLCADESAHGLEGMRRLVGLYDYVNVKLDKTGGLTEALAVLRCAERRGLRVMVGCMVATSLAMAPAMLLAQRAEFVDLDGPLLLARDRAPSLRYDGSEVHPPEPELWG